MASPLTTTRNDYHNNKKRSDIATPSGVSEFIKELLWDQFKRCDILDVACGEGSLGKPWVDAGIKRMSGIDVLPDMPDGYSEYVRQDFMEFRNGYEAHFDPQLILCNPPFNNMAGEKAKGLKPEIFAKRIFSIFGHNVPLVLFAPMGFLFNQRKHSKRWRIFRDEYRKAEITSIISMPLDVFINPDYDRNIPKGKGNRPNIEFHNLVMIWNVPDLKPFYWLSEEALK